GVVEGPGEARLLLEAFQQLRARGERAVDHLERHLWAEPAVPGAVDLGHPARSEHGEDLVGAETLPGGEAHPSSVTHGIEWRREDAPCAALPRFGLISHPVVPDTSLPGGHHVVTGAQRPCPP